MVKIVRNTALCIICAATLISCDLLGNQKPNASAAVTGFTSDEISITLGDELIFSAEESNDPDGTIEGYLWDFGNGDERTEETVTYRFPETGSFTVTLTVTDNEGAQSSAILYLSVSPALMENEHPNAQFTALASSYVNLPVSFDGGASSDADGDIVSYRWDFGDGSQALGRTASHRFEVSGNYEVILTVRDDDGAEHSTSRTIAIQAPAGTPPAADAGSDVITLVGREITFIGSASADSDGEISEYIWDFADGNMAFGETATHSYDEPGSYTVVLSVLDNEGNIASDSITVLIQAPRINLPPTAVISSPADGFFGNIATPITFDAAGSSDPDDGIILWEWNFGDGIVKSGEQVTHGYSAGGSYTVVLTVLDAYGVQDQADISININFPPTAIISSPADGHTGTVGVPVMFDGSSSDDSDGSIDQWQWSFGDGSPALTGASVQHTYVAAGTRTVRLTVTDNNGVQAFAEIDIIINP